MKFIELKKHLSKELKPIYLIEGEDRFVVSSSLKLIEKALNLTMPEVNRIIMEGDKLTVETLLDNLANYPFGDERKLVVVREGKFNSSEFKKLEAYLKEPSDYNVLVFLSYESNDFTKKLKKYAEEVDANKLDDMSLKKWIGARLSKEGKTIEEGALLKLITYTSGDLTRLDSELSKLTTSGEDVISSSLVDKFVVPDKDYQIYELMNFLAAGESSKVYDLIETMQETEKNNVGMLQYLYGAFRKLLIISLSKKSDDELAVELKMKPYGVKQMRIQAGKFTPKRLKRINNELSELEFKIKAGKANQDISVHFAVSKILLDK